MVNNEVQQEELGSSRKEYIQKIKESLLPNTVGNDENSEIEFLLKRL